MYSYSPRGNQFRYVAWEPVKYYTKFERVGKKRKEKVREVPGKKEIKEENKAEKKKGSKEKG